MACMYICKNFCTVTLMLPSCWAIIHELWTLNFDPIPSPTPVFNDRCQYCTSSINPSVTCAEHLITWKSLPIHSPEHICMAIENFEDSVFELSKVIYCFCSTLHSCVLSCLCVNHAYPMTGRNETLNFELWILFLAHFHIISVPRSCVPAFTVAPMKGQVWMNAWKNISVAVLYRNWNLIRHIFIASLWSESAVSLIFRSSSAPRSRVLFYCEVACLSLAVWALCLARLSPFAFSLLSFEVSATRRALSRFCGAVSNLQRLSLSFCAGVRARINWKDGRLSDMENVVTRLPWVNLEAVLCEITSYSCAKTIDLFA